MRAVARARIGSMPLLILLAGLLLGVGCGGSSPSSSSTTPQSTPAPPPSPEAPTVLDGWTEQPLAAEAEPPTVMPGHGVVVRAAGYLPREQIYTGELLALWPGDPSYVTDLVYDEWEFGDGSFRLIRWMEPFTMTLEGDLAADEEVVAKANQVAAELSRRTGLAITVGLGGTCRINIDPTIADHDAVGLTGFRLNGARIIGANVSLIDRTELLGSRGASYRNTFLHEMGHVVGLGHSPMVQDVMTPGSGPGTDLQEFREPEAIALHMMYAHREPGNRPPDHDEGLLAASAGSLLRTVVRDCRPPVVPR